MIPVMPTMHLRIRGSGSEAKFACGVERHSDPRTVASVAVPENANTLTCGNCRRLAFR